MSVAGLEWEPPAPAILGGYRVVEPLRRADGFAWFRAVRLADNLPVILKTAENPEARAALRREAELLRAHPSAGAPALVGHETRIDQDLILLAAFAGEPLSRIMADTRRRPGDFAAMAVALAEALAAVHASGLVHLALEPSGILYNRRHHEARILDFHHARPLPVPELGTATASRHPNARYGAPEQSGRLAHIPGTGADLYTLGVILYEALSGKPPFDDDDPERLQRRHLGEAPPPLPADGEFAALAELVLELLEKNPDRRIASAQALLEQLDLCQAALLEGRSPVLPSRSRASLFPTPELPSLSAWRVREREGLGRLADAFDDEIAGLPRLVLLRGTAGSGRGRLARLLGDRATAAGGDFLEYDFSPEGGHAPGTGFLPLLDGVLRRRLDDADPAGAALARRLEALLERDGGELREALPSLVWRCGRPAPTLSPAAGRRRFVAAAARLLQTLAENGKPLVLFLVAAESMDDLSRDILTAAVKGEALARRLTIVASAGLDRVAGDLPWSRFLDAVESAGPPILPIALEPHSGAVVADWLARTLRLPPAECRALADALAEAGAGNEFRIEATTRELFRNGFFTRAAGGRDWRWDPETLPAALAEAEPSRWVPERLFTLPEAVRRLTLLLSVMGGRATARFLGAASGMGSVAAAAALGPALRAGLLVRRRRPEEAAAGETDAEFRFADFRVAAAMRDTLPEGERARLRLRAGTRLLDHPAPALRAAALTLLNPDAPGPRDRSASPVRLGAVPAFDLACHNSAIGNEAFAAHDFRAARAFHAAGLRWLSREHSGEAETLAFQLRAAIVAAFLATPPEDRSPADTEEAERLIAELVRRAGDDWERARAARLRIEWLLADNRLEAAAAACAKLADRAVPPEDGMPDHTRLEAALAEHSAAARNAAGGGARRIWSEAAGALRAFAEASRLRGPLPLAVDWSRRAARLAAAAIADGGGPDWPALAALAAEANPFEPRKPVPSPILAAALESARARHWPQGWVWFIRGMTVDVWLPPGPAALDAFERAGDHFRDEGEDEPAALAASLWRAGIHAFGAPLAEPPGPPLRPPARRDRRAALADLLVRGLVRPGTPSAPGDPELDALLADGALDWFGMVAGVARNGYLAGRHRETLAWCARAERRVAADSPLYAEHVIHRTLAASALCAEEPAEAHDGLALMQRGLDEVRGWATAVGGAFAGHVALLEAELARRQGVSGVAVQAFARAIERFRADGILPLLALSEELLARFWRERREPDYARTHYAEAVGAWRRWGAYARIGRLAVELADLAVPLPAAPSGDRPEPSGNAPEPVRPGPPEPRPLAEAGHLRPGSVSPTRMACPPEEMLAALAAGRDAEGLALTLLDRALAWSGAGYAALYTRFDDTLRLAATRTADGGGGVLSPPRSLDGELPGLPARATVWRAMGAASEDDAVWLDAAPGEEIRTGAEAVSAVCLPLGGPADRTGALYLENRHLAGLFTPERLAGARWAGAQAAQALRRSWQDERNEEIRAGVQAAAPLFAETRSPEQLAQSALLRLTRAVPAVSSAVMAAENESGDIDILATVGVGYGKRGLGPALLRDAFRRTMTPHAPGYGWMTFSDDGDRRYAGVLELERPLAPSEERILRMFRTALAAGMSRIRTGRQMERERAAGLAALSGLAEFAGIESAEHLREIERLSAMLAKALAASGDYADEFDPRMTERLPTALTLHDVGMSVLPDGLLRSRETLSENERLMMFTHTRSGGDILAAAHRTAGGDGIHLLWAAEAARGHHERWDGTGYPDGLKERGIPLSARIAALADAFSALTSDRPYRPALSRADAMAHIARGSGTLFDPVLTSLFLERLALGEDRRGTAVFRRPGDSDRFFGGSPKP